MSDCNCPARLFPDKPLPHADYCPLHVARFTEADFWRCAYSFDGKGWVPLSVREGPRTPEFAAELAEKREEFVKSLQDRATEALARAERLEAELAEQRARADAASLRLCELMGGVP